MPELPDLLRRRLAVAENDMPTHPDADTITAFVEQSLPSAERQTVVAHLSVCGPCRELVSLSQPVLAEQETQIVLTPAPVSRWRRLLTPGFSVAAAVAAMAVIAVLVLQLPQKNTPSAAQGTQQAKATAPADQNSSADKKTSAELKEPVVAQPTDARSAAAPSATLLDQAAPARQSQDKESRINQNQANQNLARARRDQTADAKAVVGLAASAPAARAPVLTASLKKDYVNTNFFAANSNETIAADGQAEKDIPSAPQPQSVSTSNGFISAKSKMPAFADIPPNTAAKPDVSILTPTPPPQHFNCTVCKIVTAGAHSLRLRAITPAIRPGAIGDSTMGAPGMFSSTLQKNQPSEVSAAPERTEGGLANSDALSSGALGTANFKARESSATLWKVAGGKLIRSSAPAQWEDAYPVAGFQFSFVNARGNDVWAGGSSAFLIHSHDGGSSWEVVKLGDAATGTVLNILAGTLNIQVKTSDNQLWSSSDGGKTWTLQE
jgi:hypothetical protein